MTTTLSIWLDEKKCNNIQVHPSISITEIAPKVKFWSYEGKFLMGGIKDPKFEHHDTIKSLIKKCKLQFHPDKGGDSDTMSEFVELIKEPTEEDILKLLRIMSSGLTIMDNNLDNVNAETVDEYSYNFCFDLKQINKIMKKRLYNFSIMDVPMIITKTKLIMRTYEQYIKKIYSNTKDRHIRAMINGMNEIKRNFSLQNVNRMKQAIITNIVEICSSDEGHKTSKVVNGYCNIIKTFYECISYDPGLIQAFKIDIVTTGAAQNDLGTIQEPKKRKIEKQSSTQIAPLRRSKRIRNLTTNINLI